MITEDSNELEFQKAVQRIRSGALESMMESKNQSSQIGIAQEDIIPVSRSLRILERDFATDEM